MKYTFNPRTILEHRFFFRMIEKIKMHGYRPSDIFTLDVDDLKQMPELTANNLLIIMQLQKMYREAQNNAQRKCREQHQALGNGDSQRTGNIQLRIDEAGGEELPAFSMSNTFAPLGYGIPIYG